MDIFHYTFSRPETLVNRGYMLPEVEVEPGHFAHEFTEKGHALIYGVDKYDGKNLSDLMEVHSEARMSAAKLLAGTDDWLEAFAWLVNAHEANVRKGLELVS